MFLQWHRQATGVPASFPVDPFIMSLFLLQRAQTLRASSSVQSIWAALRWAHDFCGNAQPFSDRSLTRILQGLVRQNAKRPDRKKPITRAMLHKIVVLNAHSEASISQIRTALFFILGFAGLMRVKELCCIRIRDVSIIKSIFIKIKIPASKTDQLRHGRKVVIAATNDPICPLEVLRLYLSRAGDLSSDAPLFQSLRYDKKTKSYDLAGTPLKYGPARKMIDRGLHSIGLSSAGFATHSLLSGGATAAAAAGVSERLLQLHGRWASAASKDRYVSESVQNRLSVSTKVLSSTAKK